MVTDGFMCYFDVVFRLLPVIPMVLVNGCEGIGTGWSTKITKYHPVQVIQNLERLLTGEETEPFVPWFKGFNVIYSLFLFRSFHT